MFNKKLWTFVIDLKNQVKNLTDQLNGYGYFFDRGLISRVKALEARFSALEDFFRVDTRIIPEHVSVEERD